MVKLSGYLTPSKLPKMRSVENAANASIVNA
jgi:hypothetical protein